MATVPRHVVGRDTNVQIVPCTVADATGVLTEVTASNKNFVGRCDRFELRNDPPSDEFSAMDDAITHTLPLKDSWRVTMTEIQRYAGAYLVDLMLGWKYFKITAVVGGKTWVIWVSYGPGNFPYETGKSVANMDFNVVAIGATNPTYLASA